VDKTLALIKREYIQRVRTKGFLIGTLLLPLFMIVIALLPVLFSEMNAAKKKTIAVVDLSGKIAQPFTKSLSSSEKNKLGKSVYRVEHIVVNANELERKKEELNKEVQDGNLDAFLIIPPDIFENNRFEIYEKNVSNFDFNAKMQRYVSATVTRLRLVDSGMDADLVKKLSRRADFKTFKVGEKGAKEESSALAFGITYVLVMILYMALILYGSFVTTSIIEDKTSRVVEVVISSVKPYQFMAGKILGIGAAGLTQFAIWVIVAALASSYGLLLAQQFAPGIDNFLIPSIPAWVYVSFLVFFLLGYFLYATLYAAVGSMVNSTNEAQSLQWPVISLLILSILLMMGIIRNPDSTLAVVLSLIPFFTPIIMFLRISLGAAPLWQVLLSIIITLGTTAGLVWLAGRIFRVGILMYGKRPTLPEVVKWIKYS